jgi:hypothetical protein
MYSRDNSFSSFLLCSGILTNSPLSMSNFPQRQACWRDITVVADAQSHTPRLVWPTSPDLLQSTCVTAVLVVYQCEDARGQKLQGGSERDWNS